MKNFTLLMLVLTAGIAFTSCRKHTSNPNPPDTTPKGPFLYIGGRTLNSNAIYFKKSLSQQDAPIIRDTLTGIDNITDIVTSDADVYMAGSRTGYWKNGSLITLPGASQVSSIAVSGNTVYAAGWDNFGNPVYWIGNTKVNMQNPYDQTYFPYEGIASLNVKDIALSEGNVLVTGDFYVSNRPGSPATAPNGDFGILWNNGGLNLLGKGGLPIVDYNTTAGIATVGYDVYVAGRYPDTTYAGGYWKNGVWNSINDGLFYPSSIVASGSNVYIAGYTFIRTSPFEQKAAYWANGTLVQLSGITANAVAVNGNDVYVLGVDNNNKNVVWKNGNNVYTTLDNVGDFGPACIAIGN